MAGADFTFDGKGIGEFLRGGRVTVPANQRSYAWREKHIRNLLQDIHEAIEKGDAEYFLGTVVVVRKGSEPPSIVDGQQRLATTLILLARIRDHYLAIHRDVSARSIEESFLSNIDLATELEVPRIKLNLEDNEFFIAKILPRKANDQPKEKSARPSNRRLSKASIVTAEWIESLTQHLPPDAQATLLRKWVEFIEHRARILLATVPDEVGAFRMFETLNDRGLKASQADILKNFFFSRSGSRLNEAQMMWSALANTVESSGDQDREFDDEEDIDKKDQVVTFIRHLWITTHGPTKARELADAIKNEINNETKTMNFLREGSEGAHDYVALASSHHPKWSGYKNTTKQHVDTINGHIRVEQIKPMLFAIARHFSVNEADKAFRLAVSWSVRFLIVGGRGGMLDTQYSTRAFEIGTKRITKASELRDSMKKYVPSDAEFEDAFSTARVSRAWFARYLLRALDKTAKGIPQPEYVANDDVADVNLEHVMPLRPGQHWAIDEDEAAQKYLGNMALVKTSENRDLGNAPFNEKQPVFAKSNYALTKQVAKYKSWTRKEILDRQAKLAKLALKTWPLD